MSTLEESTGIFVFIVPYNFLHLTIFPIKKKKKQRTNVGFGVKGLGTEAAAPSFAERQPATYFFMTLSLSFLCWKKGVGVNNTSLTGLTWECEV